jgi:apolipoprotein N-acyltransferase
VNRLALAIAGLRGWRRYALALALGVIAAAAFAPLHVLPALPIGFTGLLWLLGDVPGWRRRFAVVWVFGWGHFIACFYWIGFAFFVDAEAFGWLVPAPVLGLPAFLALFPAAMAAIALRFATTGASRVLLFGLGWTASEWLRGHLLTGFPWNFVGYTWAGSDAMMQSAAFFGVLGLGLLTVIAASLPALLGLIGWRDRRAWAWVAGGAIALALLWVGGTARLAGATVDALPGVTLRIVQPNIPQQQHWTSEQRAARFERYLQLSAAPGADRITHWIWPESAIPYFIDLDLGALRLLQDLVRGHGLLFAGADRRTPLDDPHIQVWNSLQVIGAGGIVATYDKRHLVPFGEYMPLRPLLSVIGLRKLTDGTIDFSRGNGPAVLAVPGLPPVRPLICYEDVFADEVGDGAGRPEWLLNVSNDAWFGISSGPYQHLAMSRFRAVEQGVPLVRATTTGLSAIVDPYGRIVQRLGLDRSGIIDGALPRALDPTLYSRFGDLTVLALIVMIFGILTFAHGYISNE